MKQQQANVLEARSAREIAQASERQSEAVMLFTVITVVFLPLSTIASIYGMNASEFTNNAKAPRLKHIWKVLFGISMPLVFLILFSAFHRRSRRILGLSIEYLWLKATYRRCFPILMSWEDRLKTTIGELKERAAEKRKPKEDEIEEKRKKWLKEKSEDRLKKKKTKEDKQEKAKEMKNAKNAALMSQGNQTTKTNQEKTDVKGQSTPMPTSCLAPSPSAPVADNNHASDDTTVAGALDPATSATTTSPSRANAPPGKAAQTTAVPTATNGRDRTPSPGQASKPSQWDFISRFPSRKKAQSGSTSDPEKGNVGVQTVSPPTAPGERTPARATTTPAPANEASAISAATTAVNAQAMDP